MDWRNTSAAAIKIEIDMAEPTKVGAEKVVRQLAAWSPRSERKIQDLTDGLTTMIDDCYNAAWSLASVPLKASGLGDVRMEEIRRAVMLGCWIEVVTTVGPGVEIVEKPHAAQ